MNNKILNTSNILSSIYENNPRMIPDQFAPECHKIHIVALPKTPNLKGKRKRKVVEKKNEASNTKQRKSEFYTSNSQLYLFFNNLSLSIVLHVSE